MHLKCTASLESEVAMYMYMQKHGYCNTRIKIQIVMNLHYLLFCQNDNLLVFIIYSRVVDMVEGAMLNCIMYMLTCD